MVRNACVILSIFRCCDLDDLFNYSMRSSFNMFQINLINKSMKVLSTATSERESLDQLINVIKM